MTSGQAGGGLKVMLRLLAGALCLIVLAAGPGRAIAEVPMVKSMAISKAGKRTVFSADLTFAVGFNVYVLANPYRVIIDLPEVNFQLPPGGGRTARGVLRGFRYGLIEKGRSRIIMDATGPVLIHKSYITRANGKEPAHLAVALIATSADTFSRLKKNELDAAKRADAIDTSGAVPRDEPVVRGPGGAASDPIGALITNRPVIIPRVKPKRPGRRKRVIVIDPGHGGMDPGASSRKGALEKKIVLAFARELRDVLNATGRYRIVLTRNRDRFVSLRDRVKVARVHHADLFIAIHADSLRNRRPRGATVYTLSETGSDKEADELARKENRSDIIAGVDLDKANRRISGILIDLAQRESKNHSIFFAKLVVHSIRPVVRLTKRPMRSAAFRVLMAPDVPSVLLELGYLSNRRDAKLLVTAKWRKKAAQAIARSVHRYFANRMVSNR